MEVLSLCLSDIPKERIKRADNGKCYINIVVNEMRQEDHYGNTLTCYVQQSKEERDAKADKCYVGKGKVYEIERSKPITPESVADMPTAYEVDDLPF